VLLNAQGSKVNQPFTHALTDEMVAIAADALRASLMVQSAADGALRSIG
jgi:hypothetical protein